MNNASTTSKPLVPKDVVTRWLEGKLTYRDVQELRKGVHLYLAGYKADEERKNFPDRRHSFPSQQNTSKKKKKDEGASKTQLRRFYNAVVTLRDHFTKNKGNVDPNEALREVYRLQIILAYEMGRKRPHLNPVAKMNGFAIKIMEGKIGEEKARQESFWTVFQRYIELMEAIVAFHAEGSMLKEEEEKSRKKRKATS